MGRVVDLRSILLIIGALLSLSIIIYILLKGKKNSLLYSFISYQTLIFMLGVCGLAERFKVKPESLAYRIFENIPLCFLGTSFLVFCLFYTNSKINDNYWVLLLVFTPPAICYFISVTNDFHHLFYYRNLDGSSARGVFYWFNTTQLYSNITTGIVIFIWHCIKHKKSSLILLLSSAIILMINVLCIILSFINENVSSIFTIISTIICASVTSVFFSITVLKYRFLSEVTALKRIIDSVGEPIFFADNSNKIIYYNNSLVNIFFRGRMNKDGNSIGSIVEQLRSGAEYSKEANEIIKAIENGTMRSVKGELNLKYSMDKIFTVEIYPILCSPDEALGRVVSFKDVSVYKKLVNDLSDKNEEIVDMNEELTAMNEELTAMNEELIAANDQLKNYASTVEELTIAKERNRFARDAHDTVGHNMSKIITLLEVCNIICESDPVKTRQKLGEAVRFSRECLHEIRRSISGMVPQELEFNSLTHVLKKLFADFSTSGINIDFTVDGMYARSSLLHHDIVYRVCQEALTNSLRHGKAKNITVVLRFEEEKLKLYIFDDGFGCKYLNKGLGLSGMEQRVKSAKGIIEYGSDGEKGFNIYVELPVGG
ncbi:MAG: histidine kinase [Clostridia bacterium]|nr:histidine kinase [Clostridia bacterium]